MTRLSAGLARRHFSRRKLRNTLITVAVALSVTLIISSNIATQSISSQVVSTTRAIGGDVDLAVQKVNGEPFNDTFFGFVADHDSVKTQGGVAAPRFVSKCIISGSFPWIVSSVVGVDPAMEERFGSSNCSLYPLTSGDNVICTDDLALAYGFHVGLNIRIGIRLANGTDRYMDLDIVSIAHVERKGFTAAFIVNIDKMQWLFASLHEINMVIVKLGNVENTLTVRDALHASLSVYEGIEVVAPKEKWISETIGLVNGFGIGLNAVSAISLMASVILTANCLLMAADERRKEMGVLRAVGASRSSLFKVFVFEAMIQGVLGSILGVVLGVLLSTVMAFAISAIVGYQPASLIITPQIIFFGFLIGITVTMIGSFYPAFVASVTPAAKAMRFRTGAIGGHKTSAVLASTGVVLILGGAYGALAALSWFVEVGSVFLIILGSLFTFSGLVRQMARAMGIVAKPILKAHHVVTVRNVARNRRRTSLTIGMVSIGLTFVIFVGSIQGSVTYGLDDFLYNQFGADIMIRPQTPVNLTSIQTLNTIEGVSHFSYCEFYVTVVGPAGTAVKGVNLTAIAGIETATFPLVSSIELKPPGPTDLGYAMNLLSTDNNTIILTTKMASDLGVTVGNNVTVPLPDHMGYANLTVVALFYGSAFIEYGDVALDVTSLMSFNALRNHFNLTAAVGPAVGRSNTDGLILVKVKQGQKPSDVVERIKSSGQLGSPSNLDVLTSESIMTAFVTSVGEVVLLFQMLLIVSVVIALIGLSTTMLLSFMERRREVGILRAIGMSKKETLRAVLGESLMLGLAGLLMGFINAFLLTWIFLTAITSYGLYLPFVFPLREIVYAIALTIGISLLSGAYPARLTSKLKIVDAIKYG